MNGQSICREPLDNGHRCGRLWGHSGDHYCCVLHANRQAHIAANDRRYGS